MNSTTLISISERIGSTTWTVDTAGNVFAGENQIIEVQLGHPSLYGDVDFVPATTDIDQTETAIYMYRRWQQCMTGCGPSKEALADAVAELRMVIRYGKQSTNALDYDHLVRAFALLGGKP
jgi:hypothetical protein